MVLKAYNETCPGGISATSMVYVSQIVYYVDANSTDPTPPYTNWSTAATNIQDALDVASTAGALVLVANGVYRSGGTVSSDGSTNCVVVNWPVTLQSVNGPAVTMIDGSHLMRCAYLTNGIVLTGFTLTNGYLASGYGGGIYCATTNVLVSNCLALSNTAADGGGVYCGTLNNCTLTGNTATNSLGGSGGGAYESVLNYCLLDDNSANDGGGALGCTLSSCVISNNLAVVSTSRYPYPPGQGGGVYSGTAHNCLIVSNTAAYQLLGSSGGGAYDGALVVHLSGNFATSGAGAFDCSLVNCALVGNRATSGGGAFYDIYGRGLGLDHCLINANGAQVGGGVYSAYLTNCIVTVIGQQVMALEFISAACFDSTVCLNSATNQGGGIWGSSAQNSIIYYNTAPAGPNSWGGSPQISCCTWPWPDLVGSGTITNEPLFVDLVGGDLHLQSNSPCINSGNNAYVTGVTDLDGNPRIVGGTVDIGAYEYQIPVSRVSYAWLQQYGLPITTNIDTTDLDGTAFTVVELGCRFESH